MSALPDDIKAIVDAYMGKTPNGSPLVAMAEIEDKEMRVAMAKSLPGLLSKKVKHG